MLHVDVGDCIAISLRNDTRAGPVSLHADQLAFDPASSAGVAAGREPPQAVAPGQSRQRPFLTTNNQLLGTGSFATPLPRTEDYVRGYLTGMIRGDGLLKIFDYWSF